MATPAPDAAARVRALLRASAAARAVPPEPSITKALVAKLLNPTPPDDPEGVLTPDAPYPDETHPHTILGVVLVPDEVDGDGDVYDARTIERAAHWYMLNGQRNGISHNWIDDANLILVESFIAPVAMTVNGMVIKAGTWLIKVACTAEFFARVEAGEFTGFSFGGYVQREKLA